MHLEDGGLKRCHQDHIRKRLVQEEPEMSQLNPEVGVSTTPNIGRLDESAGVTVKPHLVVTQ